MEIYFILVLLLKLNTTKWEPKNPNFFDVSKSFLHLFSIMWLDIPCYFCGFLWLENDICRYISITFWKWLTVLIISGVFFKMEASFFEYIRFHNYVLVALFIKVFQQQAQKICDATRFMNFFHMVWLVATK